MPRGLSRGLSRGQQRGRHKHSLEPTRSASFHTVLRRRRAALVAAPVVTALVIAGGLLVSGAHAPRHTLGAAASQTIGGRVDGQLSDDIGGDRTLGTTRSADRVPLVNHRLPMATGRLWTTAALDLHRAPSKQSQTAGELKSGQHVSVTGKRQGAFAEVIIGRLTRWVTADYLSKSKERPPGSLGLVDKPCPATDAVESGLTSGAVRVYRAVCNNFPQITQYGGYAPRGEHSSGKAIDIMVGSTGLGGTIAQFLQAHAAELDLYDIIWQQHIWTPVRASEGWRSMPDRGSETANHFDHVHVSVN